MTHTAYETVLTFQRGSDVRFDFQILSNGQAVDISNATLGIYQGESDGQDYYPCGIIDKATMVKTNPATGHGRFIIEAADHLSALERGNKNFFKPMVTFSNGTIEVYDKIRIQSR